MKKQLTEPELKWTKPEARAIKLNMDAAFFVDKGDGATAAVIRDHQGKFLAAQCSFVPHAAGLSNMEAMAMYLMQPVLVIWRQWQCETACYWLILWDAMW